MEKIDEISKKFSQSFREFPNQEKFENTSLSMNVEVEEPPLSPDEDPEEDDPDNDDNDDNDDDRTNKSSQKVFSKPSENLS